MLTSNPVVFYDDTGRVVLSASNYTEGFADTTSLAQLEITEEQFASLVPGKNYVIDGELLVQPDQPSVSHIWDPVSFTWLIDLSHAKRQAKMNITLSRNKDEADGFEAYGKTFDSDAPSIQRISLAVQAAQAIGDSFIVEWTCADNTTITLGYTQLISLPAIMAQAANTMHIKARSLKEQIDSATTLEEISAVVW